MSGAFDVANGTLKQAAVGFPVKWLRDDLTPFAVLGDGLFHGITVEARAMAVGSIPGLNASSAFFLGVGLSQVSTDAQGKSGHHTRSLTPPRTQSWNCDQCPLTLTHTSRPTAMTGRAARPRRTGLFLVVDAFAGEWFLASSIHDCVDGAAAAAASKRHWLAHGACGVACNMNVWHALTLSAPTAGGITGTLNGVTLFTNITAPKDFAGAGAVCLGTSGYYDVRFDDFHVKVSEP